MEELRGPSPGRVNANNPADVQKVHQQFPELTHQEIIHAIQTQGPVKTDILNYLSQRQKDKDPGSER